MMEQLLSPLVAGIVAGLLAWGGLRVEMRVHRRLIEAAHDRLDAIQAPAARVRID